MTKAPKTVHKKVSKRSLSRLMAVQTLYQYLYHEKQEDILDIMNEVIDNYLIDEKVDNIESYRKKIDCNLLNNLLNGILLVLDKIDAKIKELLTRDNDFEQMSDVMLQILRLGAFELTLMKDTPKKAVINEYVDITNAFYDKKKVNFVNAILDKISNQG